MVLDKIFFNRMIGLVLTYGKGVSDILSLTKTIDVQLDYTTI